MGIALINKRNLLVHELYKRGIDELFEEISLEGIIGFKYLEDERQCDLMLVLDESNYSVGIITIHRIDKELNKLILIAYLNELNEKYRTSKFYINDCNEVVGQIGYIASDRNFDASVFLTAVLVLYKQVLEEEAALIRSIS